MTTILIVRQDAGTITEAERETFRKAFFRHVDGLGDLNRKRLRRWVNSVLGMEPGEITEFTTKKARSGPFHRRHMALEQAVFESQEAFEEFKPFRDWLKVGAGHCDWHPHPSGEGVYAAPRSISYTELEEGDMREFHDNCIAFLRTDRACSFLWPHVGKRAQIEAIEATLGEFGE